MGVLYRGSEFVEGVLTTEIVQDGWNSTARVASMIEGRFKDQIHLILLKGITLGGLNVVDIKKLYQMTEKPVLVVMRSRPNMRSIEHAVSRLPNPSKRMKLILAAGKPCEAGPLFVQTAGMTVDEARAVLPIVTARGNIPEALRVAHIIAGGITRGESRGRA